MTAVASQGGNRGFFVANPTANRKPALMNLPSVYLSSRLEAAHGLVDARGIQGSGLGTLSPHPPFPTGQKGGRFPTFPPLGFF